MVEIRFHGRGGQGAVIASKILASAFFKEGKHAQAFPAFGSERRGAPVMAFTRIDRKEITRRSMIYEPDHVVVLDEPILDVVDVTAGLKDKGWILINTPKAPPEFPGLKKFRVATVDANRIAVDHSLGSISAPVVNTVILGAFARITGLVGLAAVLEGIKEYVPSKPESNIAAAKEAYEKAAASLTR
ncbi:MAG TPA: 2-oxoacid:acceptor oxidoreductase family protein [Thermodesulfobacteriota bacterium]|nr:2-oxoacid:acceptor oxidoreductase family protein [Thermodesulfobacteriota bacterium]